MNKTLYIRADADTHVGTGHVMRCLALGQAWKQKVGGPVVFMSRLNSKHLQDRLVSEGFSISPMPAVHPDQQDSAFVKAVLTQGQSAALTWLILDGYHFDRSYQKGLSAPDRRLMVIDDNAHLPDYCCDLLLNQNLHAARLEYRGEIRMKKLLGPGYALLRSEFDSALLRPRSIPPVASRILITLGGADRENRSAAVLKALNAIPLPGLEIKILVGPSNPHYQSLAVDAESSPHGVTLLSACDHMAELMHWAHAAVTAAGTTTYEMAASGLPFITMVIADNQERNAAEFAQQGIAPTLGWLETLTPGALRDRIAHFLQDPQWRQRSSAAGRLLVDGGGARRVVEAMKAADIYLRPVQWEDGELLLDWANDPGTRRNSFNSETIRIEDHKQWLRNKLKDRRCRMYLVLNAEADPMGVVRFDVSGSKACISVNLAPTARNQGLGSLMIAAGCDALWNEGLDVDMVEALIREDNPVSRSAFAKAGFQNAGAKPQGAIPALAMVLHRFPMEKV